MRHPDDPARLADDPSAPAPLAEALRAARGTAPDPERLARLGVALGLPLPPALVPPPPRCRRCRHRRRWSRARAPRSWRSRASPPWASSRRSPSLASASAARPSPPASRPIPAVVEKVEARAPEPLEDTAPPLLIDELSRRFPPSRRRRAAATTRVPPPHRQAPTAPPEAPSDAASRLREEAALVQRAERLLDADPAAALRLTDERRRRFPTGALDQEAEVVAIDALLRLGRRADATTRARTFEAAHAGSLHARRIKRLMGN